VLTNRDIYTLNAARLVLRQLEKDATERRRDDGVGKYPDGYDYGRLAQIADSANTALFDTLNIASSYCGVEISGEQLHLRKIEEAEV